jgi:MOSC domain-containing protein
VATLGRINVTPVKGTALHHPSAVELVPIGIAGNRRFHLADARGRLYSGLGYGPLVRVACEVEDGHLRCRFPDGRTVVAPTADVGGLETTDFDGRAVPGRPLGGEISEAFSDYVGESVRLFRTERDGDGPDEMPLTIVSVASVEELGRHGGYEGALDPLRFRINLELDGMAPFEEETWDARRVRIGGAIVRMEGQIPRCAVTTQSPTTGLRDWNTLKQIASFRPLMATRQVPFGMYATVEQPGTVAVGDTVAPVYP